MSRILFMQKLSRKGMKPLLLVEKIVYYLTILKGLDIIQLL